MLKPYRSQREVNVLHGNGLQYDRLFLLTGNKKYCFVIGTKSFLPVHLYFLWIKGKSLTDVVLIKKNGHMGITKKRQWSVSFTLEWRKEQKFQSVTATCMK